MGVGVRVGMAVAVGLGVTEGVGVAAVLAWVEAQAVINRSSNGSTGARFLIKSRAIPSRRFLRIVYSFHLMPPY